MVYVLTNRKSRQTSLPAKHGNDVFEFVHSWTLRQVFDHENRSIEASGLDAYLKHMAI